VNEEQQGKLAEIAAVIGVELFVMDDGWFGSRNHDQAGLGDWYVNPTKFPQGLKGLIDKVNSLGMDFGLWVEPEMVNPDSDLYRAHPDWVYFFETRENTEIWHQFLKELNPDEIFF
jgi:alpha-galactosidase